MATVSGAPITQADVDAAKQAYDNAGVAYSAAFKAQRDYLTQNGLPPDAPIPQNIQDQISAASLPYNDAQHTYYSLRSSLDEQQAVPAVKTLNSDGVAVALADQASTTQYTAPDYSLSPPSGKEAEGITKLTETGLGPNFTSLSRPIGLPTINGQQVAVETNAAPGTPPLTTVGPPAPPGLPANATPIADSNRTNQFKFTLVANPGILGGTVVFNVMPAIHESRSVTYEAFTPMQHPGEILKYKNTSSRSWQITVDLISRTVDEATTNLQNLNLIRSWAMPFYGEGTAANKNLTAQYLGAPPPVLTMTAYGMYAIGPVKVIMESYSWNWPNEVDYLPTSTGEPFPVVLSLSINLKESFSPAEYSGFDYAQFQVGYMPGAYSVKQNNYQTVANTSPFVKPPEASIKNTSQPQTIQPNVSQALAALSPAQKAAADATIKQELAKTPSLISIGKSLARKFLHLG